MEESQEFGDSLREEIAGQQIKARLNLSFYHPTLITEVSFTCFISSKIVQYFVVNIRLAIIYCYKCLLDVILRHFISLLSLKYSRKKIAGIPLSYRFVAFFDVT
jgi:hypothetical protein